MKSNIIDIEGKIAHMTEKAVLFSATGYSADAVWLPLSTVEISDPDRPTPQFNAILTLPEDLAIRKGLV